VSLAVYRITQEALANVAKHATRANTRVQIIIDDVQHVVRLRVHDGGGIAELREERDGTAHGMGVSGMRRRAELLGGTLFAGPDPAGAGGWLVECTLPTSQRVDPVS
jgi:signal transduction histidine kinase